MVDKHEQRLILLLSLNLTLPLLSAFCLIAPFRYVYPFFSQNLELGTLILPKLDKPLKLRPSDILNIFLIASCKSQSPLRFIIFIDHIDEHIETINLIKEHLRISILFVN